MLDEGGALQQQPADGGVESHSISGLRLLDAIWGFPHGPRACGYGSSRTSTTSFFVHHTQRISVAVQQWDAAAILRSVAAKKRKQIAATMAVGGAA